MTEVLLGAAIRTRLAVEPANGLGAVVAVTGVVSVVADAVVSG